MYAAYAMRNFVAYLVLVYLVLAGTPLCVAAEPDHIGIIKSLAGDAVIVRSVTTITAVENMKLLKGDHIATGNTGKVGMIFEDDTVMSIGPNSRIVIEDFAFQPSEKKLSFIAKILQGTVSYVSGQIAKLAPNRVRIETPHATVGTRGTHVLLKVE